MRRAVLALLVAAGCGGEKKEAPAEQKPPGRRDAAPAPADRARPGLDRAAVAALVESWKDAQNRGDFAAYQALYAARMTGVKRVGARVYTFDRAGWMKDRGRMFGKKMEVAADQVEVTPAAGSALVRLVQRFKQGRFQDVGPKELVVVAEGGGLRIAREEMLASTVIGAGAAGGPLADFHFILDGEVLVDPDGGGSEEGAPALVAEPGSASFRARAELDRSSLEPAVAALLGKKVAIYGADGALCETQLGRASLVAGLTPHFGTAAEWRGEGDQAALGDAAIAREVWDGGRTVLVADAGICKAGLFARAGSPVVAFEPVDDLALAGRVKAAFRKLPEWQATQKSFAESGGTGEWDQGDRPASVLIVRHPTSGKTWAVVHATGGELCSPFSAEMTVVLEQVGAGWKNRSAATLEPFEPAAAFDLDGDGVPELVAPLVLVRDAGDGFDTVLRFAYPDHDCPC